MLKHARIRLADSDGLRAIKFQQLLSKSIQDALVLIAIAERHFMILIQHVLSTYTVCRRAEYEIHGTDDIKQ